MKNVLILGDGYVTSKIKKYWKLQEYTVYIFSRSNIDYTIPEKLISIIDLYKPEYVINCYGYTGNPNVDQCEYNARECYLRNFDHNIEILNTCQIKKVICISISTGCLYNDETGNKVFTESCEHNFGVYNQTASMYSKIKSMYENYVTSIIKTNYYLLRIRMPFDDENDSKNYISKLIKYDKLINYKNSITYMKDLVFFIQLIIQKKTIPFGIYNVVNKNPITTEDILKIYNTIFDKKKKINKYYVVDDLISEGLMKCRRSNCVLSTSKIEYYYPELLDSKKAVEKAIKGMFNKRYEI